MRGIFQDRRVVNFLKLFMLNFSGQVVTFILYPFIGRAYASEDFASYGFALSLSSFLAIFATGQLHSALLNPDGDEEVIALRRLALTVALIFSTATGFVIVFVRGDLVLVPVLVFCLSVFELQRFSFIREQKFTKSGLVQLGYRLVGNGLKLLPFFYGMKAMGLLLTEAIALGLGLVLGQGVETKLVWDWKLLRKYRTFPMFHSFNLALSSLINDFPILIWAAVFESKEIGFAVMAQKLISTPALVVSNAVQSATIHHFKGTAHKTQFLLKLALLLSLVGGAGSVLVHAFGGKIFNLLLGASWSDGVPVFECFTFLLSTQLFSSSVQAVFTLAQRTYIPLALRIIELLVLSGVTVLGLDFFSSLRVYILTHVSFDLFLLGLSLIVLKKENLNGG